MKLIYPTLLACALQAAVFVQLYAAPGDLDLSFNAGPAPIGEYRSSTYSCFALQADGKIVVGGSFTNVQGVARNNLARLNSDGSLDLNFSAGSAGPIRYTDGILTQPDGKILIWGTFPAVDEVRHAGLVRLNPDGSADEGFLFIFAERYSSFFCVALQRDGKILLGGVFNEISGVARANLARLNSDGSLDNSFLNGMTGPNSYVSSIVIQRDNKILVAGALTNFNGLAKKNVARLTMDGTLDPSFVPRFSTAFAVLGPWTQVLGLQSDDKIVLGLYYVSDGDYGRVLRLNPDGSTDNSFFQSIISGGHGFVNSLAVQSDDKIVFGGILDTVNGVPRTGIARLNADGTLDDSFNVVLAEKPGMKPSTEQLLIQNDGKILLVGYFVEVNGTACSLARLAGGPYFFNAGASPSTCTAEMGTTVEFSIDASGYTAPIYQWYFNDDMLPGCTDSVLQLKDVSSLNVGAYAVIVTNCVGASTSSPALLSVIAPVERRIVPGIKLSGAPGSLLHLEYVDSLESPPNWQWLADVTLSEDSGYYFELAQPLPLQRFMRARQQGPVGIMPYCQINLIPALTASGVVGQHVQVDYINQFGPTDAWVMLDTVTMTNTSQLYFDVSAPGQPARLYRLVPLP